MEEVGGDLGFAGGATRRRFLVLHRGEFRCRSLYCISIALYLYSPAEFPRCIWSCYINLDCCVVFHNATERKTCISPPKND